MEIPAVEATLNYLAPQREKPRTFAGRPPPGEAATTPVVKRHLSIHDGRRLVPAPDLDEQGFRLVPHHTRVSDCYDADEVRSVYWREMERLVAAATGAIRVVAFDHNVRCRERAERGESGAQKPVRFVHNDYTEASGPQRVRDLMGAEAEDLLRRRVAIVNVWRPIRGPVQELPLAVCDAQSMRMADFVRTDLQYAERTGEVYSVAYNAQHRWFYFPDMRADEAMLLKCYDSATDGRARFTAHSAFHDPTSPPDASPRESIEVRTLVFFDEPA